MDTALSLNNVCYRYANKYRVTEVLKGVNWRFEHGKTYAVIGKSGSGKTTLLSLMAGLHLPCGGEVTAGGRTTRETDLNLYRRKSVAVVYQSFRLFPMLTALENVMYPLELSHVPTKLAREKALACIERVGLPPELVNSFPGMLSGGEQQRVAIARSLVTETGILLADEPTGNLDEENSAKIIDILTGLARRENYCVVIVTHDLGILDRVDVVARMQDGVLVEMPKQALEA